MRYSPVIVFVYRRPDNTNRLLTSLSKCMHAKETDVFVYSDAAKNEKATKDVDEVREIIRSESWKDCFKTMHIIEAKTNQGLANSIINGVTNVITQYGTAIVIEDDNVAAYDFIDYMDRALDYYESNPKVGHVGAYTLPIEFPRDYKHDVFIMGRGSSYAWATWKKSWDLVDWDVSDYPKFKYNLIQRIRFDRYGRGRSKLLDQQMKGKVDSWAIRFSYAMFKNDLSAILPVKTRVSNSGFDGKATHNQGISNKFDSIIDNDTKPAIFENVEEDSRIRRQFAKKLSPDNILKRLVNKIIRCIL